VPAGSTFTAAKIAVILPHEPLVVCPAGVTTIPDQNSPFCQDETGLTGFESPALLHAASSPLSSHLLLQLSRRRQAKTNHGGFRENNIALRQQKMLQGGALLNDLYPDNGKAGNSPRHANQLQLKENRRLKERTQPMQMTCLCWVVSFSRKYGLLLIQRFHF